MKRVLLGVLLLACAKEKERAAGQLSSHGAKDRVQAVRALAAHARDDDAFAALSKAIHDGSPAVRSEAAAALAGAKRDDAIDAVAPLLRDPDDSVRIAAAHALASRCGERANAYLRLAFAHSGAAVRAELVESLRRCGVPANELLHREEEERRRKGLKELESPIAARKARGAHELGLLGREEDAAALLPLLADRDGVVAAAAARALGDAGAVAAVPRIAALLDEGGEVGAAAAEALLALHAQSAGRAGLEKLARAEGPEAVAAAVALSTIPEQFCAVALDAANARAAAILAARCDAGPFAAKLEKSGHRDALIAALLQARGPAAKELDRALSKRLKSGDADMRLPQLALRYRVAGRALVDALRKEQAARAGEIARKPREPDEGSAAEIAKVPAPGVPQREKYDRLMARLKGRDVKTSAAERLGQLLQGSGESDRRDFIAAALRAAVALKAPGAEKVAGLFAQDPDPLIASAARGEPEPQPKQASAPSPANPRTAIWSDDGAARAQACSAADPALDAARRLLAASDPERRVRLACAATNETAARK